MSTKQEQRVACRKARNNLSMFEYTVKSRFIIENLRNLDEIYQAKTIASYNAKGKECYLDDFNHYLQEIGKRVVYPVTNNGEMEFYQTNEFEIGEYGIKVPNIKKAIKVEKNDIDVILVPLVGFDENRFRLGQGGGYYDKYLAGYCGTSIGIGFECQKVEKIICEKHDKRLDIIVSEQAIY